MLPSVAIELDHFVVPSVLYLVIKREASDYASLVWKITSNSSFELTIVFATKCVSAFVLLVSKMVESSDVTL